MSRIQMTTACLLLAAMVRSERLPIKITTGTPNPTPTPVKATPPEPRRVADPLTGPVVLQSLDGQCFRTNQGAYTYELCPFRNVTQRESSGAHNTFWGILGLWGAWSPPSGTPLTYSVQEYNDGTDCAGKRRFTHVTVSCGPEYKVADAREPKTCEYALNFQCPEACADGALEATATLSADSPSTAVVPASSSSSSSSSLSPSPPSVSSSSSNSYSMTTSASTSSAAEASAVPSQAQAQSASQQRQQHYSSPSTSATGDAAASTAQSSPAETSEVAHASAALADAIRAGERFDFDSNPQRGHELLGYVNIMRLEDVMEQLSRIERKLDTLLEQARPPVARAKVHSDGKVDNEAGTLPLTQARAANLTVDDLEDGTSAAGRPQSTEAGASALDEGEAKATSAVPVSDQAGANTAAATTTGNKKAR